MTVQRRRPGGVVCFPVTLLKQRNANRVIKLNFSAEKNVIRPDAFAEDWTYTFTVSPVTKNPFQRNPPAPPVDAVTRAAVLAPVR